MTPTPRRSDDESFWWCVERVCRRVAQRAAYGQFPLGATTAAMATQVLEQMSEMKARTESSDWDGLETKRS